MQTHRKVIASSIMQRILDERTHRCVSLKEFSQANLHNSYLTSINQDIFPSGRMNSICRNKAEARRIKKTSIKANAPRARLSRALLHDKLLSALSIVRSSNKSDNGRNLLNFWWDFLLANFSRKSEKFNFLAFSSDSARRRRKCWIVNIWCPVRQFVLSVSSLCQF